MNIMTGGDELGQMMVEHPKIAQISFTGSAATGKKIMATGAATLKKVRARPFLFLLRAPLPPCPHSPRTVVRSSRLCCAASTWQYNL